MVFREGVGIDPGRGGGGGRRADRRGDGDAGESGAGEGAGGSRRVRGGGGRGAGRPPGEGVRGGGGRAQEGRSRRMSGPGVAFPRDAILAGVAAELKIDPATIAASMFADLKDENRMISFDDLDAEASPPALQRRAGAIGPAEVDAGAGRGPQREAGAVSATLPLAQVPSGCSTGSRGAMAAGYIAPDRRPAVALLRDEPVRAPDGPVPPGAPALLRLPPRRRTPLGQEAGAPDLPPGVRRRPRLALPVTPATYTARRDRRRSSTVSARSRRPGTSPRPPRSSSSAAEGVWVPDYKFRPPQDRGPTSWSRSSASGSGRASIDCSGSCRSTGRAGSSWRSPTG